MQGIMRAQPLDYDVDAILQGRLHSFTDNG